MSFPEACKWRVVCNSLILHGCFDNFLYHLSFLPYLIVSLTYCQVLKRLKKHSPDESKDNSDSASRTSLVGGIAPISLKIRQHSQDSKIRKHEDCRKARSREPYGKRNFPLHSAANVREPPSLELRPKRLKLKGPSSSHDLVEHGSSKCRYPAVEDRE